jgi:hypothetical protein
MKSNTTNLQLNPDASGRVSGMDALTPCAKTVTGSPVP